MALFTAAIATAATNHGLVFGWRLIADDYLLAILATKPAFAVAEIAANFAND